MKKLNLFLISIILISGISCSSDDDNGGGHSGNIVGKWAYVNTVVNNGTPIPYDDHEDCGKDYIEFKSDNTFIQIDVWDCEEDIDAYGNYTFENNILTLSDMGESYSLEIIQLTQTSLSLKGQDDYNEDGTADDIIINLERL